MAARVDITADVPGLSPGRQTRGEAVRLDWHDERLELYARGLGDEAIADQLGLDATDVAAWRLSLRRPVCQGVAESTPRRNSVAGGFSRIKWHSA